MTETEHLHLKKPGQGDYYNVDDFNENADLIDAKLKEIDESKGQPSGIATLDSNGKLAQMPTAADVGAVKLRWSTIINETTATPNKYNFDDYITPGDVVSVDNYASAQSVANIPEQVPGKLYVLPLRTDEQGRNDLMQEYHTITGNIYVRSQYYYSGNSWSGWRGTMPDRATEQLYVLNITPGYRNFNSYISTGARISVLSNNTAASIYNCPSKYPGILEVTALSDDLLMQTYHDTMGVTYTRSRSDGSWHNWDGSDITNYAALYEGVCSTDNTTLTLSSPISHYRLIIVTGTTNQYGTHWAQSNVLLYGASAGEGGRKFVVWKSDRGYAKLQLGDANITFRFTADDKLQTVSGCSSSASITGVYGIR